MVHSAERRSRAGCEARGGESGSAPASCPTLMAATDTTRTTTGRELVLQLASKHAPSMLAVARRYSLCADDAHDAGHPSFVSLWGQLISGSR